jgi:hypothetical protein
MMAISRRGFVAGSLASANCLVASGVGAQPVPPSITKPGAAGADLSPGTRLVFLGAAATIPGEREQIEPDANGEWINRRTGQRYRQFETPGPAGAGYVVIDVLAAEPGRFVLWFTSLLMNIDIGAAGSFIDANGLTTGTQNIADYWVSPTYLATLPDRNQQGLRVLRMPYVLDGRTYRAIRIQSYSGGGWSQNTYDLETGVLIAAGSTTQGGPVSTLDPNKRIVRGAGSTLLTFTRFAGRRRTSLPGPGLSYPEAVRRLRSVSYAGTRTVTVAGNPAPPLPVQLRYDVSANSGAYLNARMHVTGGAMPLDRVIPAGMIGSLWMPPELFAAYSPGQTLDRDPVTKVDTIVAGRQGNLLVVLAQTPLARQTFAYDARSGLLTQAEQRQQIGLATDVLWVQLAGTQ